MYTLCMARENISHPFVSTPTIWQMPHQILSKINFSSAVTTHITVGSRLPRTRLRCCASTRHRAANIPISAIESHCNALLNHLESYVSVLLSRLPLYRWARQHKAGAPHTRTECNQKSNAPSYLSHYTSTAHCAPRIKTTKATKAKRARSGWNTQASSARESTNRPLFSRSLSRIIRSRSHAARSLFLSVAAVSVHSLTPYSSPNSVSPYHLIASGYRGNFSLLFFLFFILWNICCWCFQLVRLVYIACYTAQVCVVCVLCAASYHSSVLHTRVRAPTVCWLCIVYIIRLCMCVIWLGRLRVIPHSPVCDQTQTI